MTEVFFDALDLEIPHVKLERDLGSNRAAAGRTGAGGTTMIESIDNLERQRATAAPPPPPPPPRPQTPPPQVFTPPVSAPQPPPPPPQPITASELRLAASAALRLAVEAIDALYDLKQIALEIAGDVRELLEATKRVGVVPRRRGGRGARRTAGGGLGVRTRAQTRRARGW